MNSQKRIFIVGHMGAGKALIGQALAERLGWQFIDTYLGLERYVGRSTNECIGKQGEDAILQCQAQILAHYINKENVVITTDDTMILSGEIRKMLSPEYVIYLKVSTPVQIQRMSGGSFPLSPLLPTSERKAFLDKLHAERDHLFEEVAKFSFDSKSINDDLHQILKALEEE